MEQSAFVLDLKNIIQTETYNQALEDNRNELFRILAMIGERNVALEGDIHYMDLRPYQYSSTVCRFNPELTNQLIFGMKLCKYPSTVFLCETKAQVPMLIRLLKSELRCSRIPIMTLTGEDFTRSLKFIESQTGQLSVKTEGLRCSSKMPLDIIQVKSSEVLTHWCRVIATGMFEEPTLDVTEMVKFFMPSLELENYILLIGYENEKPVSGGIGYLNRDSQGRLVGGLYMIATKPEARKKGYGFALTTKLSQMLLDRGADYAILDASEMGFPLYERMGYVKQGFSYRFKLPD